jgi:hypothetical protein
MILGVRACLSPSAITNETDSQNDGALLYAQTES